MPKILSFFLPDSFTYSSPTFSNTSSYFTFSFSIIPKAFRPSVRFETPVGDHAQFDLAHYDMWINGRKRTVYYFSMILAACGKKDVCFSLKADTNAIYEAIQELFEGLGGVTLELVIDNPKALVTTNNPKSEDEIEYNPMALMLAKHLGTELNACNCYWPRTKGWIGYTK